MQYVDFNRLNPDKYVIKKYKLEPKDFLYEANIVGDTLFLYELSLDVINGIFNKKFFRKYKDTIKYIRIVTSGFTLFNINEFIYFKFMIFFEMYKNYKDEWNPKIIIYHFHDYDYNDSYSKRRKIIKKDNKLFREKLKEYNNLYTLIGINKSATLSSDNKSISYGKGRSIVIQTQKSLLQLVNF